MHKKGLFHRDIKPYFLKRNQFIFKRENILLAGDTVKLADYGSV